MTHEDSDAGGADTARAGGRKALHETPPRQHARALPDAALWRVCAAEAAGAALLVLLTCLPGCASTAPPPLYRALASGLVVAVLVQSLDHISGAQMNPTVTLAAILWRRIPRRRGLAMMAAQLAGATLGGAALHWVLPARGPALCVTLPAADLGLCKAVAVEAVLGGCLALVNCASWDARNAGLRDSWPLRIGLSVAALSLVGVRPAHTGHAHPLTLDTPTRPTAHCGQYTFKALFFVSICTGRAHRREHEPSAQLRASALERRVDAPLGVLGGPALRVGAVHGRIRVRVAPAPPAA